MKNEKLRIQNFNSTLTHSCATAPELILLHCHSEPACGRRVCFGISDPETSSGWQILKDRTGLPYISRYPAKQDRDTAKMLRTRLKIIQVKI